MSNTKSNAVAVRQDAGTLEAQNAANANVVALVTKGDLSKLTPEQITQVYIARCDALGLDVRATPFELINFKGKTQLYPKKEAAEQLRRINGISIKVLEETVTPEGILRIHVQGTDRNGRVDEEVAALFVKNLQGEDLANAMMKAHTKAKRRLTLSMCGLGAAAEIDDDDPRILRRQGLNLDTGELVAITESDDDAERAAALRRYHAAGAEVGLSHDDLRIFAQRHCPDIESLSELAADQLKLLADVVKDAAQHGDAIDADAETGEIVEHDTAGKAGGSATSGTEVSPQAALGKAIRDEHLASIYDAKSRTQLGAIADKLRDDGISDDELKSAWETRWIELGGTIGKKGEALQPELVTAQAGDPGDDRFSR